MNKKGLKRLAKHLQSRDAGEPYALDNLKRLNQAGLDLKGQVSTAYAQSGIGMSLEASLDFGSIAGPGVHLVPKAALSGARTAHGLFVLSRMPKRLWEAEVTLPPCARFPPNAKATPQTYPHSDWNTQYPVTLAFLRGHTLEFAADLSAGAWVGFGAAFDTDETGATAGLQFKAGGSGIFTGLRDPNPSQYRGPYSRSLKEAATWSCRCCRPKPSRRAGLRRMRSSPVTARRRQCPGRSSSSLPISAR